MEKLEISKSIVYYNTHKYRQTGELREYVNSGKIMALVLKVERDLQSGAVIVLGGDGTFLKAIHASYQEGLPYLGVNFGTKGFLLNSLKDIDNSFSFEKKPYPLISCTVIKSGKSYKSISFNEVDVRANTGKIIDLDITISGKKTSSSLATNLKGDGFVFSTPAGSTGYNFSLGGPIIPHELKTFVLTPKAPWLPRYFKSVLVNDTKKISIKNVGRLSDIKIICDGTDFIEVVDESIEIVLERSQTEVTVLVPENETIAWEDKIFYEQSFS